MRAGADVVYQATFFDETWRGHADFLLRVEHGPDDPPSAFGAWHYEVADTKLARHVTAGAVLQICAYVDQLTRIQGVRPERLHVALGGSARETVTLRVDDFMAYYRRVKADFLAAADEARVGPAGLPAGGHLPGAGRALRRLPLVGRLPRPAPRRRRPEPRRRDLRPPAARAEGAASRASGPAGSPPGAASPRSTSTGSPRLDWTSRPALERVREQARIQVEGEDRGEMLWELLEPEWADDRGDRRADARRPTAASSSCRSRRPNDLFLDLEGDPFAFDDGIDYLFGILEPGAPRPTAVGRDAMPGAPGPALPRRLEPRRGRRRHARRREGRLRADGRPHHRPPRRRPDAPRLPLRRLREDRARPARPAPRHPRGGGRPAPPRPRPRRPLPGRPPGDPRQRRELLDQAARAALRLRARRRAARRRRQHRRVRGLARARRRRRRASSATRSSARSRATTATTSSPPGGCATGSRAAGSTSGSGSARRSPGRRSSPRPSSRRSRSAGPRRSPRSSTRSRRPRRRRPRRADAGAGGDAGSSPSCSAGTAARTRRSGGATSTSAACTDDDLVDEREPIGMVELDADLGQVDAGTVPASSASASRPRSTRRKEGRRVDDPRTQRAVGKVREVDELGRHRHACIGPRRSSSGGCPRSLVPYELRAGPPSSRSPSSGSAAGVARAGWRRRHRDARRAASRRPRAAPAPPAPAFPGERPGALRAPGESALDAARRLVLALDGHASPIQGPPGTGKTYTGARMILDLVAAGKTRRRHREQPQGDRQRARRRSREAAAERGSEVAHRPEARPGRGAHLRARSGDSTSRRTRCATSARARSRSSAAPPGSGRAPAMAGSVDVLLVDEAGQLSLANTVAVVARRPRRSSCSATRSSSTSRSRAATRPAPSGARSPTCSRTPGGVRRRCRRTAASSSSGRGGSTRRSAPTRREVFYASALRPIEGLERQALGRRAPLDGTGIRWLPVEHAGNDVDSARGGGRDRRARSASCSIRPPAPRWIDREGATSAARGRATSSSSPRTTPTSSRIAAALRGGLGEPSAPSTSSRATRRRSRSTRWASSVAGGRAARHGVPLLAQPPQRRHLAGALRGRGRRHRRRSSASPPAPAPDAPRQRALPPRRGGSGLTDGQGSSPPAGRRARCRCDGRARDDSARGRLPSRSGAGTHRQEALLDLVRRPAGDRA